MGIDQETVERVREFNRFYTDILGLINQHILQSGFSLTEARILYELSTQGSVTANQLAARLKIDKSYMSRILAKFARDELITKKMSEEDNRALLLELTTKGNDMTAELRTLAPEELKRRVRSYRRSLCCRNRPVDFEFARSRTARVTPRLLPISNWRYTNGSMGSHPNNGRPILRRAWIRC